MPPTTGDGLVFLRVGDRAVAGGTPEGGEVAASVRPDDIPPPQRVLVPAMRARHEKMPLIGNLKSSLYAGETFHGRSRDHDDAPVPEVLRSGDGKVHRIALAPGTGGVAVHLVEEEDADRARGEAAGGVGPYKRHMPAGESFVQDRVS